MRERPGGERIPVAIGDMADVPVTGPFTLVFLVFNTLFNLPDQDRQVDCFRGVARVLAPGGAFVLECFVPDLGKFDRGSRVETTEVTEDSATIEVYQHDFAAQRYAKQTITFGAGAWNSASGTATGTAARTARTARSTSRSTGRFRSRGRVAPR